MTHKITKTPTGHVCQAVNPYLTKEELYNAPYSDFDQRKIKYKEFERGNPPYPFIHPNPETLPDEFFVDGEDLGEPFWQVKWPFEDWLTKNPEVIADWRKLGYPEHRVRRVISFKHPELMFHVTEIEAMGKWVRLGMDKSSRDYAKRLGNLRTVFIRKAQPTCHTPHQELFNYMSNEHNVTLLNSDVHEIIDIVGRIEQGEERELDLIEKIRKTFAKYRASEGCSCCRDNDSYERYSQELAELLKVDTSK